MSDIYEFFKKKYEDIEKSVDWNIFRKMVEGDCDERNFYELANYVYKNVWGVGLSRERWKEVWDRREISCKDYEKAKNEFIYAILLL